MRYCHHCVKNKRKITYTAFLAVVSLLLTEPVVRLVRPQKQLVRSYMAIDPELGPVHRPHSDYTDRRGKERWGYAYDVHINDLGLRMPEDVRTSSAAERILMLGNSVVFGWGNNLKNSFYGRLYEHFRRQDVLMLNGGHGTYSTGHARKFATQLLTKTSVNGIICFVSMGDMIHNLETDPDYRVYDYRIDDSGRTTFTPRKVFPTWKRFLLTETPYNWLNQHSHAFVFAKEFLKKGMKGAENALENAGRVAENDTPAPVKEQAAAATGDGSNAGFSERIQVEYGRKWEEAKVEKAWHVTRAHLRKLQELCRDHHAVLMIAWLPASYEILNRTPPQVRMLKYRFRSEFGHNFVDKTGAWREKARGISRKDLYYGDGHWTSLANQMFAELLTPSIKRMIVRSRNLAAKPQKNVTLADTGSEQTGKKEQQNQ